MVFAVQFDTVTDGYDGADQQEKVNAFLTEFAPTVGGRVLVERGPGGGWPVVEYTADTRIDMDRLLRHFLTGGEPVEDEVAELWRDSVVER